MTFLFHFEEKVHRRDLTWVESIPLLFLRLLCQVLEHIGFLAEPRLERCRDCEAILTIDKWQLLPCAQNLSPQDIDEDIAVDHLAEDTEEPQITQSTAPTVTTPLPTSPTSSAPPVPPAPTASVGPSTSAPPPQHISISTQDFLTIMDAVCTFSSTSASFAASHTTLPERMTSIETAFAQNHDILMQSQNHLGLPPISPSAPAQASLDHPLVALVAATHLVPSIASLDMLAAAVADSSPASSATPQPAHVEDDIPPTTHH